jgi:hypothetical protein
VLPGECEIGVEYVRVGAGGGALTITVGGEEVGRGTVGRDLPFRWQIAGGGLLLGHDRGFPVCGDYEPPFPCTAEIRQVVIEQPGTPMQLSEEEVAASLRHE